MKRPSTSQFFDLDTSGDSITLPIIKKQKEHKIPHVKKRKEHKKRNHRPASSKLRTKSMAVKKKAKSVGQANLDFKKKQRKEKEERKSAVSASIESTIEEVVGANTEEAIADDKAAIATS